MTYLPLPTYSTPQPPHPLAGVKPDDWMLRNARETAANLMRIAQENKNGRS